MTKAHFTLILGTLAVAIFVTSGSLVFAEEAALQAPYAVTSTPQQNAGPTSQLPNESFLINTKFGTQTDSDLNKQVQNQVYGDKLSGRLTQEYQDLNRDYEMKQNYGLVNSANQLDQQNKNSEFGKYLMRNVMNYQLDENLKKADKNSSQVQTFHSTAASVDRVIHTSSSFHLSDDFKFGSKTDLPGQRGQLWMKSIVFDANFDARAGKGFSLDPMHTNSLNTNMGDDHMRAQMSRDLGLFGLKGSMNYGFDTTRVNQVVSKQITPHISAEVASTRGIDPVKSGMAKPEQSVRMSYGIKF